jgi:hypothetical protein
VAGLLLTAALVGAIALAHREGDDTARLMRSRANAAEAAGHIGTGMGPPAGNGLAARTEALVPPSR